MNSRSGTPGQEHYCHARPPQSSWRCPDRAGPSPAGTAAPIRTAAGHNAFHPAQFTRGQPVIKLRQREYDRRLHQFRGLQADHDRGRAIAAIPPLIPPISSTTEQPREDREISRVGRPAVHVLRDARQRQRHANENPELDALRCRPGAQMPAGCRIQDDQPKPGQAADPASTSPMAIAQWAAGSRSFGIGHVAGRRGRVWHVGIAGDGGRRRYRRRLVRSGTRRHPRPQVAAPGRFQRFQLLHGRRWIEQELQRVAGDRRRRDDVAAMFEDAGDGVSRLVERREADEQRMIAQFEGQGAVARTPRLRSAMVMRRTCAVPVFPASNTPGRPRRALPAVPPPLTTALIAAWTKARCSGRDRQRRGGGWIGTLDQRRHKRSPAGDARRHDRELEWIG